MSNKSESNAIGFLTQTKHTQEVTPLIEENFTNAICYGQTGTGKTTCFILPNIKERIRKGHGVLVYDVKGNLHEQVKYIASELGVSHKIYEIGKPWGKKIDILKNISRKTLKQMFDNSTGQHQDRYWNDSAFSLFETILFMVKDINNLIDLMNNHGYEKSLNKKETPINKYNTTLKKLYINISGAKSLENYLRDILEKLNILRIDFMKLQEYNPSIPSYIVNKMHKLIDTIAYKYNSLSQYHDMSKPQEVSGKYAVVGVLNNLLMQFASNDSFSKDEVDISNLLLDGNIVIINLSNFNDNMINFFNTMIYSKLLEQTAISIEKKPITIFLDEAHRALNDSNIPDVDLCRENKFEFIFSTQDISLLANSLGERNSYLLTRNIAKTISFKTSEQFSNDINTHNLDTFEYFDTNQKKKYKAQPLFIDQKDLLESEYQYQKSINIKNMIYLKDFARKKYILKYSSSLDEENKAYIYFIKEKKIQEIDLITDENYESQYFLDKKRERPQISNERKEYITLDSIHKEMQKYNIAVNRAIQLATENKKTMEELKTLIV